MNAIKSFLNPANLIRRRYVSPSWSHPRSLNCTHTEFGQLSIGCSNLVLRNESRGTLGGRSHFLRGECTVGGAHPNATLPGPPAASKTLNEGGVISTRRQELIIFLLSPSLAILSQSHRALCIHLKQEEEILSSYNYSISLPLVSNECIMHDATETRSRGSEIAKK